MTDRLEVATAAEDRTLPAVVYGLYLLGLANGLTIFIGLLVAYANRPGAGLGMRSHYTFLIRTFWLSIGWFAIGAGLVMFGLPLSLVLVGIPIVALGWTICSLVAVWFAVRVILGVILLARGSAYPRPYAWLF
jgi:uncharacterized membrane protein